MNIKRFEPAKNSDCLCGSGLKFKRCCYGDHLGYPTDFDKKARSALRDDNYKLAVKYSRVAVTIYTIFHKTNTAPIMRLINHDEIPLVSIDISALAGHVDLLYECLIRQNKHTDLLKNLESLRDNIQDPRWQKKILYFKVKARLEADSSHGMGKKEVKVFEPIENEIDAQIVILYVHFMKDELSFIQLDQLYEKIINLSEDEEGVIHYKLIRSLSFLYLGDEKTCIDSLENNINEIDDVNLEDYSLSIRLRVAQAISMLGDLKKSLLRKNEALLLFTSLSQLQEWTPDGHSFIHYQIGNCFYRLGEFEKAIMSFEQAYQFKNDGIINVYKALAMKENKDDRCLQVINEIDTAKLSFEEMHDFIINFSYIAIAYKNKKMIERSIALLKSLHPKHFIFERDKSRLLAEINDFLLNDLPEPYRDGLLMRIFSNISRFAILEPNFFGVGLNINNLIDEVINHKRKRKLNVKRN